MVFSAGSFSLEGLGICIVYEIGYSTLLLYLSDTILNFILN
ncbi:hypothetical protein BDD30_4491 [Photorhabdus asymbiotica]|uniref:Uncharacterized protein n=1 Tax=Photorhabdus asymbiotica TaxID=291112 RepID=A0ABX9SKD2_9GAMM|nr:hypothetical protein BDD30_4491 [Photorhabdus asymbiotica]